MNDEEVRTGKEVFVTGFKILHCHLLAKTLGKPKNC
jgi:hypothetical protein